MDSTSGQLPLTRMIQRAYKTELNPTPGQRQSFLQHAGACRFLYNLALERCQTQYTMAVNRGGVIPRQPNAFALGKELTVLKHSGECDWLNDVSNAALGYALRHADAAYANFFRRIKAGKRGRAAGYPRFKSKKHGVGSFTVQGCIHVTDATIQLPRIGVVRLKEHGYLPASGARIVSATVSEQAGRWYVSIQVEEAIPVRTHNTDVVGIDLGLNRLATLSDGTIYESPKPLRRHLRKLKRVQRAHSRKQKGSANRKKAQRRVARVHQHIGNIRRHTLHQITSEIVNRYGVVVMEDLNVAGMTKNHCLAQAISDASFAEFRRQIAYKLDWAGGTLILADRWYPSSKTCSDCGVVKDTLSLGERTYSCATCGLVIDRDGNAARNLAMLAGKQPDRVNAPGGTISPGQTWRVPANGELMCAGTT